MDTPIAVWILIVVLLGGHLVQVLFERDDWPFAAYTMYAHLIRDRVRNPFVPLRPEHSTFEAGILAITAIAADGSSEVLTKRFFHPLLRPLDRLRVIRLFTDRYKKGGDVRGPLSNLAAWIKARNATSENRPFVAVELQLFLWKTIPVHPQRHHPPDEVRDVERVEIAQ
jgi:hypothetical protein